MALARLNLTDSMVHLFTHLASLDGEPIEPGHVRAALAHLGEVPPFLRALLVADGTVTMALEAYFQEAIQIKTLCQGHVSLPMSMPLLGLGEGDNCLFREVELVGELSAVTYAHATSVINRNAIQPRVFEQLVDEHEGIGVVLRNVAKGSFREVLNLSTEALMVQSDFNRTYRVNMNSIPAILITEEFFLPVFEC